MNNNLNDYIDSVLILTLDKNQDKQKLIIEELINNNIVNDKNKIKFYNGIYFIDYYYNKIIKKKKSNEIEVVDIINMNKIMEKGWISKRRYSLNYF